MKNKIKITEIRLNKATFEGTGEKLIPTNINFLFGRNGTGKSTVSKVIDDSELRDQYVEWKNPDDEENTIVHVYDEDYIKSTFSNAENMSGVFTISETDVNIKKQIEEKTAERENAQQAADNLEPVVNQYKEQLKKLKESAMDDCWKEVSKVKIEFRTKSGFSRSSKSDFFEQIQQAAPQKHSDTEIQQLYDAAYDASAKPYNPLNYIKLVFNNPTNILSEAVVPKSTSQYSIFMNKIKASDWVQEGLQRFTDQSEGLCPFCHKPLEGLLKEIEDCFDQSFEESIKKINALYQSYFNFTEQIKTLIHNNTSDWFPQNSEKNHSIVGKALMDVLDKNLSIISQKKQKPAEAFALEDIIPCIDNYNSFVAEANLAIDRNNAIVNDNSKAEAFVKACREQIAQSCSGFLDIYNAKKILLENELEKNQEQFDSFKNTVKDCNQALMELDRHSTSTKPVIAAINALLRDTGFQGFHIETNDEIKNTYKIIYNDINHSVARTLSEGEKNFICFLYFYFSVMESPDSSRLSKEKDRVVVIDDPVSSMDGEAVFVISSLVRDMIENCRNAFYEYRNDDIGHHIKQIFILTHNSFFYNEIAPLYIDENDITAYFEIKKEGNKSYIVKCLKNTYAQGDIRTEEVNSLPQQSSYAALWQEYMTVDNPVILLGIMRRILEIYFLHDLGVTPTELYKEILKNNRENFITHKEDGTDDSTQYCIAASLLRFISYGYNSSANDLFISLSSTDVSVYRNVFKELFNCMHQNQHYDMMVRRSNG